MLKKKIDREREIRKSSSATDQTGSGYLADPQSNLKFGRLRFDQIKPDYQKYFKTTIKSL